MKGFLHSNSVTTLCNYYILYYIMSAGRTARITFNEVVRCVRIVNSENAPASLRELESIGLKERPIVFRPRGKILEFQNKSIFSMECTVMYKPDVKTLNGWYVDMNMCVYYEEDSRHVYRTSKISSIDGDVITTSSGSVYKLGRMDPLIKKRLDHVSMDEMEPLHEETLPFLMNATLDTYPSLLE